MPTQISKWGHSLGVRIPKAIAREARLGEGDLVDVSAHDGVIVVRPAYTRYSLEELLERITPRNRHRRTDWSRPVGKEVW